MAPMSGSGVGGEASLIQDVIEEEEHTDNERTLDPEQGGPFDIYTAYQRQLRNEQVQLSRLLASFRPCEHLLIR